MGRLLIFIGISTGSFFLCACGGHGHVNFNSTLPSPSPSALDKRPAGFNLVLGSQALVTSSTGYHAKIQLAELSGTKSTSSTGYTAKMRFTTRSVK